MNRRSILAAYKKKSSHLQTGVTEFKSGNLFKKIPGFEGEKLTIVEKFNCFLSLWAIAASIPDTLPL